MYTSGGVRIPSVTIRLEWGDHKESFEAKKKKIRIFEKSGFPGSEPDFRISVHGVEIRAPRATCSQNFRPLAAVVSEALCDPDFRKTGFPCPDLD